MYLYLEVLIPSGLGLLTVYNLIILASQKYLLFGIQLYLLLTGSIKVIVAGKDVSGIVRFT